MTRFRYFSGVLIPLLFGAPQSAGRPDFSGSWTLIEVTATGGRGAKPGTEPSPTGPKPVLVGGAVVNCGGECTIVQTVGTMTVSRPASSEADKGQEVVVYLDGRRNVGDATLRWENGKLVIARTLASVKVTQTLSLDSGRLTVENVVTSGDIPINPIILKYKRQ